MKKMCPECERIQEFDKTDDLEWCSVCGVILQSDLPESSPLTAEEMTSLKRWANRIFDEIYHDLEDAENLPMEEIVEIAFDASRLESRDAVAYENWRELVELVGYAAALYMVANHK